MGLGRVCGNQDDCRADARGCGDKADKGDGGSQRNLMRLCDNPCQQIDVQEVINVIVKYDGRNWSRNCALAEVKVSAGS